ncbi:hypothetical protein H6G89_20905 [Oscillatoria sp. FACHB-1407]|uniref:hypothetical protein n=1 Tax=Oscillatoria sp. FACHB-1407 TaxID=2692847 RepID=UPI001688E2FE|nr:hypothetical protein [Oscillatoria sp. FACHB-1407]
MKSLITPKQFEFILLSLTCLEECSEASVYAPGYIQPNRLLVVLQEPDLKILQVRETAEQCWGVSAITRVGRLLPLLFSRRGDRTLTQSKKESS